MIRDFLNFGISGNIFIHKRFACCIYRCVLMTQKLKKAQFCLFFVLTQMRIQICSNNYFIFLFLIYLLLDHPFSLCLHILTSYFILYFCRSMTFSSFLVLFFLFFFFLFFFLLFYWVYLSSKPFSMSNRFKNVFCFAAVSSSFLKVFFFNFFSITSLFFSFFFHVCSVPDPFSQNHLSLPDMLLRKIVLRYWKMSFNSNRWCDQHPLTLKHHFLQPRSAHMWFF